jgi:Gpi18-like mannosyltransferase
MELNPHLMCLIQNALNKKKLKCKKYKNPNKYRQQIFSKIPAKAWNEKVYSFEHFIIGEITP